MGKYEGSCVYDRSYLLWSPVIATFQAERHFDVSDIGYRIASSEKLVISGILIVYQVPGTRYVL